MLLIWTCGRQKSADICARLVELLGRLDAAAPTPLPSMPRWVQEDPTAFAVAAAAPAGAAYPYMLSAIDAAGGQRMCMRAVRRRRCVRGSVYRPPRAGLRATDIDSDRFPIVPAEALDMTVVPLVAFDQTGTRLNTAAVAYDRYPPMLSPACQIIGIAFDEQRINPRPPPMPTTAAAQHHQRPNQAATSATATAVPSQLCFLLRRGARVIRAWSGRRSS